MIVREQNYGLYNERGELEYIATADEIRTIFGLSKETQPRAYANNGAKIGGKYTIERVDSLSGSEELEAAINLIDKFEELNPGMVHKDYLIKANHYMTIAMLKALGKYDRQKRYVMNRRMRNGL